MKLIFSLTALVLTSSLFGQTSDSSRIKFANTITKGDLKTHLSVLASDEYEGRETGMDGQRKAAVYIENFFKSNGSIGINGGSFQQEFPILIEKSGSSVLTVNGVKSEFIKDFFYVGAFGEKVIKANDFVFVGYGISDEGYDDYKGLDVSGKIVVYLDGQPKDKNSVDVVKGSNPLSWTMDRAKKGKYATSKGAIGILVIMADYDKRVSQFKSFILNPRIRLKKPAEEEKVNSVPMFYVSEEYVQRVVGGKLIDIQDIKTKLGKGKTSVNGIINVGLSLDVRKDVTVGSSSNVMGYVEGTDLKEELLVISAHYDHIGVGSDGKVFNGADDDGSGTVAVMELFQAFNEAKKAGKGPRRSVLFLLVSGEEKGLLGSEWYTDFPIIPLTQTVCDLNIDMIGRQDKKYADNPDYVYVIGSDKLSSELHDISEKANADYSKLALDYTYNAPNDPNRFYYRSDHYNFAKNNIPVIFYFNGVHEDYHKETDEVAKINFDKMEKITRLVFHTAWDVANRNNKLVVDRESDFK